MKKRVVLLALVLICILSTIPAIAIAEAPKRGGVLTYATGTDALTLDPQFIKDVPTSRVIQHMHETLVARDINMTFIPGLAVSWSVSEDNLTWTFKLRKGVTFHDGAPFNAEAVKFTFERIKDPEIGSPRKSMVRMFKEIEVIDDYTVAFTTKNLFAPFLAQISSKYLAILSPLSAGKWGKKYTDHPAGTGPFKLESRVPGEKIVLVRNDNYWGQKPYLDKLVFKVVPEDSSRVMLLMSGEADVIASVPPVMLPKLKKTKGTHVMKKTGFRTIFIGLNNRVKPFDNLLVRRAVAHAIDTGAIHKGILGGIGTLGGGWESVVISGAHQGLKPRAYDPEKAKILLAEAGYPNGFETTFYTPTGRYLMDRQVAEAVQAQLKEVGITAKIRTPDFGTLIAILDKGTEAPMFLMGKGSPSGDLDLTMKLSIKTGGKFNQFQYANPKVDAMIVRQAQIVDQAERYRVLKEIQEIIYDEIPCVVLFYEDQLFGKRAKVHGVEVYPDEFISFMRAWKK
ncbi:glutathione ABC transporter substrate-binding protein [bacterium]|nr:glutathione ABC transporter substrate-binding protein [bacterium]